MWPQQFRFLYRAMVKKGFTARQVEVLGLNYLRFAKESWGA